ncbi:hypothetical protein AB0J72_12295 [Dactylosporangium sp. NPDC049742]|uniref:hypothetical protein n=1 Tax=Dactylosporangium sp. NPDC049742 TaxID=3154737 RepID=UPI0034433E19
MVSLIFAVLAVGMVGAGVVAVRLRAWLVVVVAGALVYDNTVIAAGRFVGEGDVLEGLNAGRFVGHALFTPLLIVVGAGLARGGRRTLAALAAVLVGIGIWADVVRLRLVPERYADTLRYVNDNAAGPPVPAVVAILVLIGVGVVLWRQDRWPWLFAGAVAMFGAAAAGFAVPWLGNLGELVLLTTVVLSLRHAHRSIDDTANHTMDNAAGKAATG